MMYVPFFSAEFGEIIQRNPSPSQKTFLSAVSMGFLADEVEFCDASRPFPKKTRDTAGRAVFFRANPRGTAGRTLQKSAGGAFWTSRRGPKVRFSARYRGPKTRSAPQENPPSETVRQNWSGIGLQNINCAPFFLIQIFFALFRTPFFWQKKGRPKNATRRETRRNEAFSRFLLRDRTAKTRKNAQNEELRGSPKRIEKRRFLPFLEMTGRPERRNDTFFDTFRDLSKPLFL